MRTKPKILIRKVNGNSYYTSIHYYNSLIDEIEYFFDDIDYVFYDWDYDEDWRWNYNDEYDYIEREDEFGKYKNIAYQMIKNIKEI